MNDHYDRLFGDFIARLDGSGDPLLAASAALAARAVRLGHSCCDLAAPPEGLPLLPPAEWRRKLLGFPRVISETTATPLVMFEDKLYLQRYALDEAELADRLRRLGRKRADFDPAATAASLAALFPAGNDPGNAEFRQKLAALTAARSHLAIISGGPGTGKTYTAARIIRLLGEGRKIKLAAPTGKAAARLQESLTAAGMTFDCSTIHRLLGLHPETGAPLFHAENPLDCDLLLLDEVSMIPLTLLAKVAAALPDHASLILLGDRNQLSSVEPGCVFADLLDAASPECFSDDFARDAAPVFGEVFAAGFPERSNSPFADVSVELTVSRRFDPDGTLGRAAAAVPHVTSESDSRAIVELVRQSRTDLAAFTLPPHGDFGRSAEFRSLLREHLGPLKNAATVSAAFAALDAFRILGAVRRGSSGAVALNELATRLLYGRGDRTFYHNMPLMIVRNDVENRLFNGDVGIVRQEHGQFRAWFPDREGDYRSLPVALLPPFEPAFAMTVHKSQGSEFDRVALILPERSEFVSRELFYTALTRARKGAFLFFDDQELIRTLLRPVRRSGGLAARLRAAI
ncbi:MAG: exodeoxyribonuclease V subunit alpha [Victivallaceae bacterium]